MDAQSEVLSILTTEFSRIRVKNPAFSQRAYARMLGLHPSAMSGLMNGKLRVTRKSANRILTALGMDTVRSKRLLQGLRLRTDRPKELEPQALLKQTEDPFTLLELDQYHVLTNWVNSGVLLLAETDDFRDDPEWISSRLGAKVSQVNQSLKRLERLGLLAQNSKGHLVSTGKKFKTTTDIPNPYIRRHHLEGLQLAKSAMEAPFSELCDFSAITMAIDPDKIPEAKVMIREVRKRLSKYLSSGSKKEVYRVSIQLFPLSKR